MRAFYTLYTNGFQESIIYELSVLSFRLTEFCLVSLVALKLFLFGLISRSGNKHFFNYRGTEDTKRQPAEFCLVSPDYTDCRIACHNCSYSCSVAGDKGFKKSLFLIASGLTSKGLFLISGEIWSGF